MIFVPIHWSGAYASRRARRRAGESRSSIRFRASPSSSTRRRASMPFVVSWHGFMLTREPLAELDVTWWTLARGAQVPALRDRRPARARRLVAMGATRCSDANTRTPTGSSTPIANAGDVIAACCCSERSHRALRLHLAAPGSAVAHVAVGLFAQGAHQRCGPRRPAHRSARRSAGRRRTDRVLVLRRRPQDDLRCDRARPISRHRSRSARSCAPARTAARACRRSGRSSPTVIRMGFPRAACAAL